MQPHPHVLGADSQHVADFLIVETFQLQHQHLAQIERKRGQGFEQPLAARAAAVRIRQVVQAVVERYRRGEAGFRTHVAGAQVVRDAQYERQQHVRIAQPRQALPDREQHVLQQLVAQRGVEFIAAHRAPQVRVEGLDVAPE